MIDLFIYICVTFTDVLFHTDNTLLSAFWKITENESLPFIPALSRHTFSIHEWAWHMSWTMHIKGYCKDAISIFIGQVHIGILWVEYCTSASEASGIAAYKQMSYNEHCRHCSTDRIRITNAACRRHKHWRWCCGGCSSKQSSLQPYHTYLFSNKALQIRLPLISMSYRVSSTQ